MATHRAMQAAGMTVTASAPMSGPYAMAAFVDAVFSGRVNSGATVSATLLITGYQKSYGNIYSSAAEVFGAQYANDIESLLPTTTARSVLYTQGKLPRMRCSARRLPILRLPTSHPRHAGQSGTRLRARLWHGPIDPEQFPPELPAGRAGQPDGGWPATTTGLAAATPGFASGRQRSRMICATGLQPPRPAVRRQCGPGSLLVQHATDAGLLGSERAHAQSGVVLDLDSTALANDPYADLKSQFALAKQVAAATAVAQGRRMAGERGDRCLSRRAGTPILPAAVQSFFAAR